MSKFSDRLKGLRKQKMLSQQDLADQLGFTKSRLNMYERGEREPGFEPMEAIADYFNVDLDYLMGRSDVANRAGDLIQPEPAVPTDPARVSVPVLGSVPAGIPLEAIEDVLDWEEIPAAMCNGGKEYFALKVQGDSMWPDYLPGDVVIVRKTPCCETGDVCVVYINGYDATLKRVELHDDGSLAIVPKNQAYPPRTYTADEVRDLPISIAGVVVEMRRKVSK